MLQLRAPLVLLPPPIGHQSCWTKISDPETLFRRPWSRCAVRRAEGLLLHDHDMEVRHAPDFCFSFPVRSGNAWPFRCVARRCIRLRPHALRTGTTDGHTGHGPWRKCGRERAERMASEAGIPGGWLALACIYTAVWCSIPDVADSQGHLAPFSRLRGPQPGPRAQGGLGVERGRLPIFRWRFHPRRLVAALCGESKVMLHFLCRSGGRECQPIHYTHQIWEG